MYILCIIFLLIIFKLIYNNFKVYKNADLIDTNLWLGNRYASVDKDFIIKNNIKLIINCSKNLPFVDLNVKKYRLPIHDNLSLETNNVILAKINQVNQLINEHLNGNKGVLIHCYAGAQRAATVSSCYLIDKYNFNVKDVIKYVKKKRPIAFTPRANYYSTLLKYKSRYN